MSKSILYIEDDEIQIAFITICLERDGYDMNMDFAQTGKEGIAMFSPEKYALVIIDYNLPDAQAPQIAEQIMAQHEAPLILFASSAYTDEMRDTAKALNVKLCIEKDKMRESLAQISTLLSS